MASSVLSVGSVTSTISATDTNAQEILSPCWRRYHPGENEQDYTAQERLDFINSIVIEHLRQIALDQLEREAAESAVAGVVSPLWE